MATEQVNEAQLMEQVSSMRSQEVMQEFLQTVRDKCFDKCVTKPSSSLSSSEQQCLARCSDRYAEVRHWLDMTYTVSLEHHRPHGAAVTAQALGARLCRTAFWLTNVICEWLPKGVSCRGLSECTFKYLAFARLLVSTKVDVAISGAATQLGHLAQQLYLDMLDALCQTTMLQPSLFCV